MKTKTTFFSALFRAGLSGMFLMLLVPQEINAQITVFTDDFNRTDVSPGGNPSLTYTVTNSGSGTNAYIDAGIRLRLTGAASGGTAGQQFVTAPLSGFAVPFKTKLTENTSDSLVWTFNVRYNYNGNLSGFNSGNRGFAVILLADNADMTTANGYAVVNGGESPTIGRYRLVKFTGGLNNNTHITALVNGQTFASVRDYISLKVKYIPATGTWSFYDRSDGSTDWADPTGNTGYVSEGTSTDDTYTSTAMSGFGFTQCYPASATSFVSYFDNYQLAAYMAIPTGMSALTNNHYALSKMAGGFVIASDNADVTVYDLTGNALQTKHVEGKTVVTTGKGLFLIHIQTPYGIKVIKQLID
jgi:hypothetical protein